MRPQGLDPVARALTCPLPLIRHWKLQQLAANYSKTVKITSITSDENTP